MNAKVSVDALRGFEIRQEIGGHIHNFRATDHIRASLTTDVGGR